MSNFESDRFPQWQRRIKLLLESAWRETRLNEAKIDQWLGNFRGQSRPEESERRLAFHLLQQFVYFGSVEVDECMRVLFRDNFVVPSIHALRPMHTDEQQLVAALKHRVERETLFFGVGHPAESGTGMLYRFRKVNGLPTALFPNLSAIFRRDTSGNIVTDPDLRYLIFIDDLCATGDQVQDRMREEVLWIRSRFPSLRFSYFVLFATTKGLHNVRSGKIFDDVAAAVTFDDDYAAFGPSSQCYNHASEDEVSQEDGRIVCQHYGSQLQRDHPLGYRDCQLLLGFQHNTPDNTLPIFWAEDEQMPWYPIFPRAHKH